MNRKQRRKVRELKKAVKDDDLEFVTGQIGDPGMHDADAVAMSTAAR
jgi:hypothetical protein